MIPNQFTVFFMIVYVLESLTIILQSGLLVAVLGREWVQVKRLSAVDMILTSLGICHFCLQWASMLNNFYSYFNLNYVFWYLSIAWDFLNTLSFWLTSLLAVVYCVKISSFTHPIFLWLRWRILRLVPWLLLGSLLLSSVTLICSAVRNHFRIKIISMEHFPKNNTMIERLKMLLQKFTLSQPMVVMIIPFLLFLASIILLMASLSQHLGQMQHHNAGHSNSSMKAHSTALRSLAIFLIFFTSYFLIIVISFMSVLYDKSSWYWVWEAVVYAIVSVQSTLLMLSSPTLKKVLKLRCWVLETA